MKIYTANQLAAADQATMRAQHITAVELMERAATQAFRSLITAFRDRTPVFKIYCGVGNNGGDGLVIARKLTEQGYEAQVFIVEYTKSYSPAFCEHLDRLKKIAPQAINYLTETSSFPEISPEDVVIDAIFGTGLNRALPLWIAGLINQMNHIAPYVIAVDLPSGLFADRPPGKDDRILKAAKTITFQSPKLSFFLPRTAEFAGVIEVIDIDLDQQYLQDLVPAAVLIEESDAARLIKKRPRFSHKGTYGHCLLTGGSYGMIGSMVLTARAALRSGAGKVTVCVPECGCEIMQISVPEAMTITAGSKYLEDYRLPAFEPQGISFGCGAGTETATAEFFKELLKNTSKPVLIDADGLNLLAANDKLKAYIPPNSVLTPHPKELERLVGPWEDDFEKIRKTRAFAKQYRCIVVVKGACSLVVTPDELYINITGNPGMATAGSGDVLTGIITGLMAQGYLPLEAAILGVYLHGKSGDIAAGSSSEESLLAGDIVQYYGVAVQQLKKNFY